MKYRVCIEWDDTAHTCVVEAWADAPPMFGGGALPTVEQASEVGMTFALALLLVASMKLLKPPREVNE